MAEEDTGLTLSIGAVSRATGVPANTLRTWERRYGFPKPVRTDGGQRAYSAEIVPHLLEVARALEQGLRPRDALTATRKELAKWSGAETPARTGPIDRMVDACRALDATALRRHLRMLWAENGGVACMDNVLGPFVREMGRLWAAGELEVFQEHFASEVVKSFLNEQWRPLSDTASGPLVVCASPSGEPHDLGLQFAATTLTLCGRRIRYLGANTPVADILSAARTSPTEAVAVSISEFADQDAMREALLTIRDSLPKGTAMLVGGAGAPRIEGIHRLNSCATLQAWARPGA